MIVAQIIDIALIGLALLMLSPIAVFCVECLAALFVVRPSGLHSAGETPAPQLIYDQPPSEHRPPAAVLIPAHDEEAVIGQTLRTLLPTLAADDRLLVVADNCGDRTAEIARCCGAEVIERNDPCNRGKGFALQFGLRHLAAAPPEVVVIIDADCTVEAQTVELLARRAIETAKPVQARNLTDARAAAGPVEAVSLLANRLTNLVRPLGLQRLGAPCRLLGTGMAFPWALAKNMQPCGASLVEDMQLGIDMAIAGHGPVFCVAAGVHSAMPAADGAFQAQRTRWEHGHLSTAARQIPRLLRAAIVRRSPALAALALDLAVPPLALLAAGWFAAICICILAWLLGATSLPAMLLAGGGIVWAATLGLMWAAFCRRQVSPRALAAAPVYALKKMPIYARLFIRPQRSWVRTERSSSVRQ
jgi:cellulose synthase/poly-beta-1,6-N-acetylglucosamine synthase-like glycosyltransferase